MLADAVGLEITFDETESSVGDFNVDIYATETGTDRKTIIENQLEDTMRTIFAEYNPGRNSIDVYISAGYMLRIDCWKAEKNLRTTPGSDCALNTLAIDEPLEYARLYLGGNLQMWGRCRRFLDIIVMFKKR